MTEKVLLIVLIEREGRFSAKDIWCILKKQSITAFRLAVIHQAGCKIPGDMKKLADEVIEAGPGRAAAEINRLARERSEEAFLFVRNYVQPTHNHWIKRMTEPVTGGKADVVIGREIPTPEANYFVALDLERKFPSPPEKPGRERFSIDNCCIKRELLAEKPFSEDAFDPAMVWGMREGKDIEIFYADGGTAMRETLLPLGELHRDTARLAADRRLAGRPVSLFGVTVVGTGRLLRDIWICFRILRPFYIWYPFFYRFTLWFALMAGNGCKRPVELAGGDDAPIMHDTKEQDGPSCSVTKDE